MENPKTVSDEAPSPDALRSAGVLAAVSVGLVALILLLIDFTGVHPGLPGRTGAEQIQQLSAQSRRWRQVHGAFSVAGVLGLLGVLGLRRFLLAGGLRPMIEVATGVGLAGAVIFTATVLAEVTMIPDLAEACAASAACLAPNNEAFSETLADVGWRVLPGLDYGARLLSGGLAALALIGWGNDRLRITEAIPLFLGAGYEVVGGTGLHGWGNFRLENGATGLSGTLVFLAAAAIIVRLALEARPAAKSISGQRAVDPLP